ncbi:MAG: porin [Phycisphaerales bacterium]|nr:porin [Phycisphaerales bacterium]
MFYRKDAVLAVVAGILASAGFAFADGAATQPSSLSLTPTTACSPADGCSSGLLMQGLDKIGVGDALKKADLNIYGWLEAGYTYDHRHGKTAVPILPGPFNHEFGSNTPGPLWGGGDRNHFMLNQFVIRFERQVKSDQWDVGGMVEIMYGTDASAIHANGLGLGFNGDDDRFNPQYQPDITQAYVDVNVPIGNGLKFRAGKFVSFLCYETIDPRNNAFYSHSYLFAALPATFTGLVGYYKINDEWAVMGGFTRGWDQCLQDNNGSSIDVVGQVSYTPNKQWSAVLNFTCGPENTNDSSHYRTTIDGILGWQATKELKLGLEGLYVYDGGRNGFVTPISGGTGPNANITHAYGDQWGGYLYGSYFIDEYVTANARAGFFHTSVTSQFEGNFYGLPSLFNGIPGFDTNVFDFTLGLTVRPFPKDPIGKNLAIRPEIRYSICEDPIYIQSLNPIRSFKDQLTFAADVVFTF